MVNNEKGLGRLAIIDERDNNYPLKALLPKKASKRIRRFWRSSTYWGDQGQTPQCVAYSWVHFIHHGPLYFPGKNPCINPADVYAAAQKIDEWPGENYDGTSVRAGAEILKEKGFISSYHWGRTIDELIQTLLELGPVVVGTEWWSGMFNPDINGFIYPVGQVVGGHAWMVDGCDTKKRYFRLKNSWSRSWGVKGWAYISFDDMEKLIANKYSEICLAIECRKTP